MKQTFSKFIVLSLLIFAVLEKSGVSVMSLILADPSDAYEMILSEPERKATEAENTKEASAKEIWVTDSDKNALSPLCKSLFRQPVIIRHFQLIPFYPSIPTPPPNLS